MPAHRRGVRLGSLRAARVGSSGLQHPPGPPQPSSPWPPWRHHRRIHLCSAGRGPRLACAAGALPGTAADAMHPALQSELAAASTPARTVVTVHNAAGRCPHGFEAWPLPPRHTVSSDCELRFTHHPFMVRKARNLVLLSARQVGLRAATRRAATRRAARRAAAARAAM